MGIASFAPCPCGSARPVEACCGAAESDVHTSDLHTVQPEAPATHVSGSFRAPVFRTRALQVLREHAEQLLGPGMFLHEATRRARDGGGGMGLSDIVGSWRLFDWVPDGKQMSVAADWLAQASTTQVDDDTKSMIESAHRRALSFYQVRVVDRGRGVLLRNLLADEETFVVDNAASEAIPRWAIVLARVVEFRTLSFFEVVSTPALPPEMAEHILSAVRVGVDAPPPWTPQQLRSCAIDLLEIYAEGLRELGTQRRPSLPPMTDDGSLLWPDIALPTLGGLTPRQASATDGGRARVEGLLRAIEFRAHGSTVAACAFDAVRAALGLSAEL
jgi:hypothetical protein